MRFYIADPEEEKEEYCFELCINPLQVDAIIIAVAHKQYKEMSLKDIKDKLNGRCQVLADIKGLFDRTEAEELGLRYWRL